VAVADGRGGRDGWAGWRWRPGGVAVAAGRVHGKGEQAQCRAGRGGAQTRHAACVGHLTIVAEEICKRRERGRTTVDFRLTSCTSRYIIDSRPVHNNARPYLQGQITLHPGRARPTGSVGSRILHSDWLHAVFPDAGDRTNGDLSSYGRLLIGLIGVCRSDKPDWGPSFTKGRRNSVYQRGTRGVVLARHRHALFIGCRACAMRRITQQDTPSRNTKA